MVKNMTHIELRDDGWFEAGRNHELIRPTVYMRYQAKQEIKRRLEEIGNQPTLGELEARLKEIDVSGLLDFKRTPYIMGDEVVVDMYGLPETCYLGKIIQ